MNQRMPPKQRMRFAMHIALAFIAACPPAVHADVGARALRVGCSTNADGIEVEPFIAWSDGNSPYPAFDAERANGQGMVLDKGNWFYSFEFSQQEFIYAPCNSKTRVVRIFVTNQQEITITEGGKVVVDALPVGDTWENWKAIYVLRSPKAGAWEECYGPQSAGYPRLKCAQWDQANPHSTFLSKPAASTK